MKVLLRKGDCSNRDAAIMNLCSVLIASIQLGWKLAFIAVVSNVKDKRYPKEAVGFLTESLQRLEDTESASGLLQLADEVQTKTAEFEAEREKAAVVRMQTGYPELKEKFRVLERELKELQEAADKMDPGSLRAQLADLRSKAYSLEYEMDRRK